LSPGSNERVMASLPRTRRNQPSGTKNR